MSMPEQVGQLAEAVTVEQLADLLAMAGVDISTWGIGSAKTVAQLLKGVTSFKSLHELGQEQELYTPDSYPGLATNYETYSFVAVLDNPSFNPEGYIEPQADKVNYYTWEKIRGAAT